MDKLASLQEMPQDLFMVCVKLARDINNAAKEVSTVRLQHPVLENQLNVKPGES